MGLTFVPTPLGNLRDVTLRAIDALSEATVVVAEDTRVARRLLGALGIGGKEIVRCDDHASTATIDAIVERARNEAVAVTTDAGTPGISDPGSELVRAARSAGIPIEVLPGPSALVVAAALSGFDLRSFSFEGFVPRTAGSRREELGRALRSGRTSVWYESPHRILATLEALAGLAPGHPVFLARELTKLHEEQLLGTASEIAAALEKPVRGEIVLVLAGIAAVEKPLAISPHALDHAIDQELAAGRTVAAIAKELARQGYGERSALYSQIAARKARAGD
jgi:16S rRNA (cytidine1402-2'-O)-methyltransferase